MNSHSKHLHSSVTNHIFHARMTTQPPEPPMLQLIVWDKARGRYVRARWGDETSTRKAPRLVRYAPARGQVGNKGGTGNF